MAVKKENTRISVTMPKELYNELLRLSDIEDRSVSNMILTILKEHLNYNTKNDKI